MNKSIIKERPIGTIFNLNETTSISWEDGVKMEKVLAVAVSLEKNAIL